ncbi:MAG: RICIN domain-containing protein [Eubacterium sp.]|nr:RICIN domain-containing protein [Eubacterium sp.]
MSKCIKKVICMALTVIMILSLYMQKDLMVTEAATTDCYLPITCYTISTGRVSTYSYSNGRYTYTGYISGLSDRCVIQKAQSDGYCKVTYPTTRGLRTAFAQSNKFFVNTDFSTATMKLGKRKTVYRRADLSQSIGTVYADDQVQIVGTSGNKTQIIYPAGSSYKMGWVSGTYSVNGNQNVDIADGYYQIKSAINSNYVLDVYGGWKDDGTNIQLYKNQCSLNQGFLLKKQSDGYYTITALHSGKSLDVENNGNYSGVNVLQWTSHGGNNQKWKIVKTSDGYYSFISKCNGLYLDVNGGVAANETNIQCWVGNGTKAQKFILEWASIGGKEYQDSEKVNQNAPAFQIPLTDARCSWRSSNNWSWGENVNGGGYSSSRVYHLAIDIIGSSDDVYATADGTVVGSGWNNANGNYVVIQHDLDGKTIYSFYAHLASRIVSRGTNVSKGQKIGVAGSTGNSGGKHLHFAITDTFWDGSYYGYSTYFTGNTRTYAGVTYYNPVYVINNGKLP